MPASVKLTSVSITRIDPNPPGERGRAQYDGVANYRAKTNSVAFVYSHKFEGVNDIAEAVTQGGTLFAQELGQLQQAAQAIQANLGQP